MATILEMTPGPGALTREGKRLVAGIMYEKGSRFLGSAILLRRADGDSYVFCHLICQGLELVLKGLLLLKDYDRYAPKLKRPFGHDLAIAADEVADVYGRARIAGVIRRDLEQLNELYCDHLLRYGTIHDVFIDVPTIPYRRVLRRICRIMRLVQRRGLFAG